MKTEGEFEKFYNPKLLPKLMLLEKQRKKILSLFSILFLLLAAVLLYLSHTLQIAQNLNIIATILWYLSLLFFDIWVCKALFRIFGEKYINEYKRKVIQTVANYVNSSLTYVPNAGLNSDIFNNSRLFRYKADIFESEDGFKGTIGETEIVFSEVHAWVSGLKGGSQFDGILLIADFNKSFKGLTIVLPENAESLFGTVIGQTLQSLDWKRPPLVKLESPEFEKQFVVYGEDQVNARYILSPSLMQRLVGLKKLMDREICASFLNEKLILGISYGNAKENFFEPNVFGSHFETLKKDFQLIQSLVGVVDDLNLNTRIWSKQ